MPVVKPGPPDLRRAAATAPSRSFTWSRLIGSETPADALEELALTARGDDTPSDLLSLEYMWDWGDGQGTGWSQEASATHSWTHEGMFEVRVHVRDDDGESAEASHFVSVSNVAPIAIATVDRTESMSIGTCTRRTRATNLSDDSLVENPPRPTYARRVTRKSAALSNT